ncbi:hypothetical protein GCM10023335_36930 [Streptomyces siamensis]|uniref:Uncharacterized protein n=1 Tax=Streptomyces siamensis TaxID=1274986 RepID=A0ABP9IXF8_9ACTN
MPVLSSQASSLGRRAVIEFTFQVAMRMPDNLPGGYDNGPTAVREQPAVGPCGAAKCAMAVAVAVAVAGEAHTSAEPPGASRRCSEPPRAPICRS